MDKKSKRVLFVYLLLALVIALAVGIGHRPSAAPTPEPTIKPTAATTTEPTTEPTTEQTTEPTAAPTTAAPTAPPETGSDGNIGYFDDALFIGDSRTEGLALFCRLGNAEYFCGTSLISSRLFEKKFSDKNFEETDLESLLSAKTYGKIYMMLGINEVGYHLETIQSHYRENLDRIRALQPSAKIFVVLVYGVSKAKAQANDRFSPANIDALNDVLASLCDGKQFICLDPRPVLEDGEGYMRQELTSDGVHPYASTLKLLNQWFCEQAK